MAGNFKCLIFKCSLATEILNTFFEIPSVGWNYLSIPKLHR